MKLTTSQPCALAAKAANNSWICVASRLRKVVLLYSALVKHIWGAVSSSPVKESTLLEQVQQWATKLVKGLEYLLYKMWLRALGPFSLEKRKLEGILSMCKNT